MRVQTIVGHPLLHAMAATKMHYWWFPRSTSPHGANKLIKSSSPSDIASLYYAFMDSWLGSKSPPSNIHWTSHKYANEIALDKKSLYKFAPTSALVVLNATPFSPYVRYRLRELKCILFLADLKPHLFLIATARQQSGRNWVNNKTTIHSLGDWFEFIRYIHQALNVHMAACRSIVNWNLDMNDIKQRVNHNRVRWS